MPLEHPGSVDRSAEHAAERVDVHAATQVELSELDATVEANEKTETPSQRTARLGAFVETHFAEVCPPDALEAGTEACVVFEDWCRELFEEPSLQLEAEDTQDAELIGKIKDAVAVEKAKQAVAMKTEIDQTTLDTENGKRKTIGLNVARQRKLQAENDLLRDKADKNDETIAANDHDIATLEQTQARFNQLKAEHDGDTIATLRSLLASDQMQSPQIREYLQNTIATAETLRTALPGKENVVTQLLNASTLELSAGGGAATFADFMMAIDASDDLTDADKTKLRAVLHGPAEVKTGSDIKAAFA